MPDPSVEPPIESPPDDVVLPCGCLIRCAVIDGTNTITISPCRQSCPNLANAIALANEQAKPVEYRRG